MAFLRELGISTGWVKPRPGEFLPEHQELGIAYQALALTFRDSRRELERKPDEEEMVRDLMGRRIRDRALRVIAASLQASFYSPDYPGPHEISIGDNYLFSFKSKRLLIKPAPGIKVEVKELIDAPSQAWFEHGMNVVNATLDHLANVRGLPSYLAQIELPS